MSRRRSRSSAALVAALFACSAPAPPADGGDAGPVPELGLAGTIPIYWGEADGITATLNGEGEPHWARAQLERSYRLQPIDVLDQASLAPLDYLLLAQPRALSGPENVALDEWVRAGGRLLLFADPLMTGHSRYAIGDRRRPQDVILLSPILAHWGLELQFREDEPAGPATREIAGEVLPVNLPGQFVQASGRSDCTLAADGVLARCQVGKGEAVLWADGAILDLHPEGAEPARALGWLAEQAFGKSGDHAGRSTESAAGKPDFRAERGASGVFGAPRPPPKNGG